MPGARARRLGVFRYRNRFVRISVIANNDKQIARLKRACMISGEATDPVQEKNMLS